MRLSTKIAGWLVFANMAMMTAPGMIVVGLGGWPLQPWLPPMVNDGGLNISLVAGFLWPIGMPLVIRVLDRWKRRWQTDAYSAVVVAALYLWAVLVSLLTLFLFAERVPMPIITGKQLQLDRSDNVKGPDTDNNGIRDDIDAWIGELPVSAPQKRAVQQAARVLQAKLLVDLADKAELTRLSDRSMASTACMSDRFSPEHHRGYKLSSQLEALTTNTKARAERYGAYHRALSGSVIELRHGDNCEP